MHIQSEIDYMKLGYLHCVIFLISKFAKYLSKYSLPQGDITAR